MDCKHITELQIKVSYNPSDLYMIKGNFIFSLKLNFVILKHPTNLHKVSTKLARVILSWCCQQFWSAAAALWWSSE